MVRPSRFEPSRPLPASDIGLAYPDAGSEYHSGTSGLGHPRIDAIRAGSDDAGRARPPGKLGDLIMISSKKNGHLVHACNYIAGDFVFSKNGNSPKRPWIFTTLGNVVENYLEDDLTLSFYRLKPEYRK